MTTRQQPNGKCWCGCGQSTANFFAVGHDRRAEAAIVKLVYGSLPDMLAEHGCGPSGKNLSEAMTEAEQQERETDQRERDLAALEPAAAAAAAAMRKAAQERGDEVAATAYKHKPDGLKNLTIDSWLEPDEAAFAFGEINLATGEQREASAQHWAERFLAVELSPEVPVAVRDMWVVARGILLYAWFFYPLYALGEDQLRRVADAAILLRYQQAVGPRDRREQWPRFKCRLESLIEQGIIRDTVEKRWIAIRSLRNYGSYAEYARITTSVDARQTLEVLAREINALFDVAGDSIGSQ